MSRLALIVALLVSALAAPSSALADRGRDGGGGGGGGRAEVRSGGSCSGRAASSLRLRSRDGGIRFEFEVHNVRRDGLWRVTVVQEGRVAWRGRARTTAPRHSFSIERGLRDLPGADRVMVRGLGPRGMTCVATATLAGS